MTARNWFKGDKPLNTRDGGHHGGEGAPWLARMTSGPAPSTGAGDGHQMSWL